METLSSKEDEALEKMAVNEILKDLKRGAERAKEFGALGWQKNPAPPPNKRFLHNLLVSTVQNGRTLNHSHRDHTNKMPDSWKESPGRNFETRFQNKDRYHQRDRWERTHNHKGDPQSYLRHRDRYPDSRLNNISPEAHRDSRDKSQPGLQDKSECSRKRHYCYSSDSEMEEKSRETKHREKRHKKHHKKRSEKDNKCSSAKKKHKKCKKSSRHESSQSSDRL